MMGSNEILDGEQRLEKKKDMSHWSFTPTSPHMSRDRGSLLSCFLGLLLISLLSFLGLL
jgi:hypothetical protein